VNEKSQGDDQAILAALAALEAEAPERALAEELYDAPAQGAADTGDVSRRLSVETLGLLAYAVEPAAVRPEVKGRLMEALPPRTPAAGEAVSAEPRSSVVPMVSARAAEAPPAALAARRPWWSAVAAVLAVAALGLAGWLYLQLDHSRAALARAELDRAQLTDRLAQQEAQIRKMRGSGNLVAAVATRGVEVCPLRPVGDMAPGAFAVLYMPPGDDTWYLVASNLEPTATGSYKVWLNTKDGPMPVGVIEPGKEASLTFPAELAYEHHMQSISVTLEPERDAEAPKPSGPQVLYGDEKMQVL
jgi:hypothetical protein